MTINLQIALALGITAAIIAFIMLILNMIYNATGYKNLEWTSTDFFFSLGKTFSSCTIISGLIIMFVAATGI